MAWLVLACLVPAASSQQLTLEQVRSEIAAAQKARDEARVERACQQAIALLGRRAGFSGAPLDAAEREDRRELLKPGEVREATALYLRQMETNQWWLADPPPEKAKPLREPASVILGTTAAIRAQSPFTNELLKIARNAADYVCAVQERAGRGVLPVPAMQGTNRLALLTQAFVERLKKEGKAEQAMVNGWIVDDLEGGELQFDNGTAGVALLRFHELTGEKKYLTAALKAADWAMPRSCVPNWNYNSFSVYLLAHAYRVTKDVKYLESAKEKARLGIYPGQVKTGQYRGNWLDSHNAAIVYHYILVRGLGALVAVLPDDDWDLPRAREVLLLALENRNKDLLEIGVTNHSIVLDVLSELQLMLPVKQGRLPEASRGAVYHMMGGYVSDRFRYNHAAVEPSSWGHFLESLAAARAQAAN